MTRQDNEPPGFNDTWLIHRFFLGLYYFTVEPK